MFSPTGVVTYAYGPQAAGCVPYWMVAATAATSAAAGGGRSPLAGGHVPGGVQPDSPARIPVASNSTYPPSAAAYHDLLKRTAQLNELLYPSVIPLPGTLTADNASPAAVRGSGPQGLRPNQDMPRTIHEPSDQRTGRDLKSPELSSLRRSGHPLSPSAVKSKDLKFGIDRILHPSRSNDDSSKAESEKPDGPRSTDSTIVRRPISKNPVLQSPVLTPPRSSYCSTAYGNAEPGIGRSLSPNRECHRPRMMSPHASHLPLNGHLVAQSMAAAAGYHHHFRPEYAGHLPSMIGHNPHQIQASQQHHHQEQSLPKRKRSWSRAVFSHLQRKGLEKRFEVQKYVTKPDRRQLAAMLGLTDAQVKVWFQNRRMKWRHTEEAKRKKEEEDKQDKTQNVSGVVNVEINSKHRDITDICLKSDDENDNGDEGEKFEYSFDDDPQHDELVVDEVSSDEDDEHGVHMVRYSSSEEHNKIDTSIYNIDKCESD